MKFYKRNQGRRLCVTNFWTRWNFFRLLLVLSVAGFAYIYLTVTPYSIQHLLLEHVIHPGPVPLRTAYTPGTNNLTSDPPKSSVPSAFATRHEGFGTERPSNSLATPASAGLISLATPASAGLISLATPASAGLISLATLASAGLISSPSTTNSAAETSSTAARTSSVGDFTRLSTTISAGDISVTESKASFSTSSSALVIPAETTPYPSTSDNAININTASSSTNINATSSSANIINTTVSSFADQSPTTPEAVTVSLSAVVNAPTDVTDFRSQTSTTTVGLAREEPPLYVTALFTGRLGNQMFIYAALIGIARAQGRTAFIKSGTDLEATFQITHLNNSIDATGWANEGEGKYATFDPKFMSLSHTNKTISGYFQSWRYFHHNQDEIRREFKFKDDILGKALDHLRAFRNEPRDQLLIGVHVRRGDYLSPNNANLGYGVPQASYFHNAFRKIRELFRDKNCTFLIASDDLNWCSENLKDPDVRILKADSPLVHFAVLANCDHMVLSGGTYGWWAAWLSPGVKIYYSKFIVNGTWLYNGFTREDYYPPDWIGLDN